MIVDLKAKDSYNNASLYILYTDEGRQRDTNRHTQMARKRVDCVL
jgi:hypothetical protein